MAISRSYRERRICLAVSSVLAYSRRSLQSNHKCRSPTRAGVSSLRPPLWPWPQLLPAWLSPSCLCTGRCQSRCYISGYPTAPCPPTACDRHSSSPPSQAHTHRTSRTPPLRYHTAPHFSHHCPSSFNCFAACNVCSPCSACSACSPGSAWVGGFRVGQRSLDPSSTAEFSQCVLVVLCTGRVQHTLKADQSTPPSATFAKTAVSKTNNKKDRGSQSQQQATTRRSLGRCGMQSACQPHTTHRLPHTPH